MHYTLYFFFSINTNTISLFRFAQVKWLQSGDEDLAKDVNACYLRTKWTNPVQTTKPPKVRPKTLTYLIKIFDYGPIYLRYLIMALSATTMEWKFPWMPKTRVLTESHTYLAKNLNQWTFKFVIFRLIIF